MYNIIKMEFDSDFFGVMMMASSREKNDITALSEVNAAVF